MDMFHRLLAPCSTPILQASDVVVDLGALFLRLSLFDEYVIDSTRLLEIPHLVTYLGYSGLMELLKSGLVRIYCHAVSVAQVGQADVLLGERELGVLGLGGYVFARLTMADPVKYRSDCLRIVNSIEGINRRLKQTLRAEIASRFVLVPEPLGNVSVDQLKEDLTARGRMLGRSIRFVTSTAASTVPLVGSVAGALDVFVLEKMLPESGPVTFLSRTYPSLFDRATQLSAAEDSTVVG
jgi:hypothetical protein